MSCTEVYAKKTPVALCGRVYLNSGDTIMADNELRIGPPRKTKKLEIIENAYSRKAHIAKRIAPETIDSIVVWTSSAPERPHTFCFIPNYGWCFVAEKTSDIALYCFSPKGYSFAGNGGLWMRGNSKMLVDKDGKIYQLGKPNKKADDNFRHKLGKLIDDDPKLSEYIKTATGRRDKILRRLRFYNPEK